MVQPVKPSFPSARPPRIGTQRQNVDVASEYRRFAEDDERVAMLLFEAQEYRHSMYFVIQATEKYLRGKIFSIVDPRNEYFREKNRNHSVEEAALFLAEVASLDAMARSQIKQQLQAFVTQDVRFNMLHNDLRYPSFFERQGHYCCLDVSKQDAERLFSKLHWLKEFLRAI